MVSFTLIAFLFDIDDLERICLLSSQVLLSINSIVNCLFICDHKTHVAEMPVDKYCMHAYVMQSTSETTQRHWGADRRRWVTLLLLVDVAEVVLVEGKTGGEWRVESGSARQEKKGIERRYHSSSPSSSSSPSFSLC